jgi:hypothetical protein
MDDSFKFSFFRSSGLTPGERAASPFRSLTPEPGKQGPKKRTSDCLAAARQECKFPGYTYAR